jgi:ribonuclease D
MEMPREEWPTFPKTHRLRATPEQERRIAAIKSHRDRIAKDLALDPSVIASRNTIEQIVYGTATPDILMPWQRELLGLG